MTDSINKTQQINSVQDYPLSLIDINNLRGIKLGYEFTYHQPEVSGSSCGIHGPITTLSNLFGIEVSKEFRQECWDLAKKEYGAAEGSGMRAYKGVDCVRRMWNKKYPDNKVNSYIVKTGSKEFYEAVKKYPFCSGGKFNAKEYNKDKYDDGDINTIEKLTYTSYGHMFSGIYFNGKIKIIDSFKDTSPNNIYDVTNFDKLCENGVYFKNAYIFIPQSHLKGDGKPVKTDTNLTNKEIDYINLLILVNSKIYDRISNKKFMNMLDVINNAYEKLLKS